MLEVARLFVFLSIQICDWLDSVRKGCKIGSFFSTFIITAISTIVNCKDLKSLKVIEKKKLPAALRLAFHDCVGEIFIIVIFIIIMPIIITNKPF